MKLQNLIAGVGLAVVASTAAAWPERPITLIVPFPPGGSSDGVARAIGPVLSARLGQPVVIENIGGAGGTIATQKAVRAEADGYTLLLGSGSEVLINKLINPKIPYDGMQDLAPLGFVGTGAMVLIGKTSLPANSMADVLALARKQPGTLNYATGGNGTPMHVAGELLKIRADVSMQHVPYRGAPPAIADIIGGQVDLGVSSLTAALPHIRAGKVKVFAVTSPQRSELAPDIPPLADSPGLAGFDLGIWFGLFAPAATPADVQQKLQAATSAVMQDTAVRKRLFDLGISASGASAAELSKFMRAQVEEYRKVVQTAKIVAE